MFEKRALTQTLSLDPSGILVMEDRPADVDQAVAAFVKRYAH